MMSIEEFKFKHPFTCIIAGTTGSGKTCWTRKLLENYNYLINIKTNKLNVLWCFGQEQELYSTPVDNVNITYTKGIPSIEQVKLSRPCIIVIDDLMTELKNDENIKNLFTKGSHHMRISVIFITQNIFSQEKAMRTISLNSQYIVILKGIRLTQQVSILGNQIFPGKSKKFLEIFKDATKNPFSYLLVDLHPASNDEFRLRTNIFREELPSDQSKKYLSAPIYYPL